MKHLGKFCQKTADSHYSLACSYTSLAAGEGDTEEVKASDAEKEGYKNESIKQYFECAMCFAGMAAELVGEDTSFKEVLATGTSAQGNNDDDDDDDDDDDNAKAVTPLVSTPSQRLKSVAAKVESFELYDPEPRRPDLGSMGEQEKLKATEKYEEAKAKKKETQTEQQIQFMFCYDMMNEMQECIDAADSNFRVLNQVAENKQKGEEEGGPALDGTTIGFDTGTGGGSSSLSSSVPKPSEGQTTFGFQQSSAASEPSIATTAQPMMVVKKKKKAALTQVVQGGETQEESASKKAKLEESN